MLELIGEKLQTVIDILNKKGIAYTIKDNNFNVKGDTLLVTNIITKDEMVEITTGNFIFDVRNKNDD